MIRWAGWAGWTSKYMTLAVVLCLVAMPVADGGNKEQANAQSSSRSLAEILALPDADIVPTLLKAIRNDPLFQDDDWKHQGYELLVSVDGHKHKAAVRQFVKGMNDPAVSCICLYALSTAPVAWHDMVVPSIKKYLDRILEGNVPPCNDISSLFEAVSHFGRHSSSMARTFEAIVEDTLTMSVIRGMAARVLMNVAGVVNHVRATEKLLADDSVGARLMLNVLLLEGESTRWSFLRNDKARKAVAGLLVKQVQAVKKRAVMERITIGGLLIESIARSQPRYAATFVAPWIKALKQVEKTNRYIGVRVNAMTKINEAQKLLLHVG